jgi:hypothetical protein
MSSSKDRFGD